MTGRSPRADTGDADDTRDRLRQQGRDARRLVLGEDRRRLEDSISGHLSAFTAGLLSGGRGHAGKITLATDMAVGVFDADDGEPELDGYVTWTRQLGLLPALPNVEVRPGVSGDRTMHFVGWSAGDTLIEGRFGIRYPSSGQPVVPSLLAIPLVRFDAEGNRLGRGAGFYDRWLAAHPCVRVGVGFECQRAPQIPAAAHDMPLDAVVTELGIRLIRPC